MRRAGAAELGAVVAVIDAAYAEFRGQEPAPVWAAYLAGTRDVARRIGTCEVLVAEMGGGVAGTASFYAEARACGMALPGGWAGFRALAVAPAARGRGLGRALVLACAARARAAGARTLAIHTSAAMPAALGLYRSVGFRRCPEHDVDAAALEGFPGLPETWLTALRLEL